MTRSTTPMPHHWLGVWLEVCVLVAIIAFVAWFALWTPSHTKEAIITGSAYESQGDLK